MRQEPEHKELDKAVRRLRVALGSKRPAAMGGQLMESENALADRYDRSGDSVSATDTCSAWSEIEMHSHVYLDLEEDVTDAIETIKAIGVEGVVTLLKDEVHPLYFVPLLRVLGSDWSYEERLDAIKLASNRDLTTLLTVQAVRTLRHHDSLHASCREPSESSSTSFEDSVSLLALTIQDLLGADERSVDPVALLWGALRELYTVLGQARKAPQSHFTGAALHAFGNAAAQLVENGVDLFPEEIQVSCRSLCVERSAILPIAASMLSAGSTGRSRCLSFFDTAVRDLLNADIVRLPGDVSSAWSVAFAEAAALDIVLRNEEGLTPDWWAEALEHVDYSWGGWKFDQYQASCDAERGAWLLWIAKKAHKKAEARSMNLDSIRDKALQVGWSRRIDWLWHSAHVLHNYPTLILPLVLCDLSSSADAPNLVDRVVDLAQLTWSAEVLEDLAGRISTDEPDKAELVRSLMQPTPILGFRRLG
ncbi:MAG: hypothetical protein ABIP48_02605 [Planctomycetota bacterium]